MIVLENKKRGLGVLTRLDWLSSATPEEDVSTEITTTATSESSSQVLHNFKSNSDVDKAHRFRSRSFAITIKDATELVPIMVSLHKSCDLDIFIEDNVTGNILLNIDDLGTEDLLTSSIVFRVGKNANITIGTTLNNTKEKLHISKHLVIADEQAKVTWFTQTNGSKQIILEKKAELQGKGASVNTIATTFGEAGDNFDIETTSHHQAPNTSSDIVFRSVLSSAKVLARGLVKIDPEASGSQGYQQSHMIMLDKQARAITIPDLEIHNKDVSCSHGSTITNISQEKLFYLQSRGLSQEEAKKTIVNGFIDDLYADLPEQLVSQLRGETSEE